MSGNTFGRLFTVTTFGESHGLGLGCVIDGGPPAHLEVDALRERLDVIEDKMTLEIDIESR